MHNKRMTITAVTIVVNLFLTVSIGIPWAILGWSPGILQAQGPGAEGTTIYLPLVIRGGPNQIPVAARYQEAWEVFGGTAGPFGNATAADVEGIHSEQRFEHGMMYWRDNATEPDYVYVLYYEDDDEQQTGTWERYDDEWEEGMPIYSCAAAEDNRPLGPKLGFGLVWCTHSSVRTGLGAAIEEEQYYDGAYQDFEGGIMLWSARDETVTVLYDDRTWEQ